MKANDWQDTIAMAASAIEDLLETADEQAGCWADVPARLRALTAPPAPAAPEEINPDSPIIIGILPDSDWTRREKCIAADMWNACRAAMLAQPVSSSYKLPDGWRLVPIDATRAMIDAAQRVEEDGYDAMHKAMLAAAPEGGN